VVTEQASVSQNIDVQNNVGITTTTHTDNSTNKTVNNTVDNSIHINVGMEALKIAPQDDNSFSETYLESTIEDILKNPAFYELARENGVLHQELCKTTHYGSNAGNHNIVAARPAHNRLIVREGGEPLPQDMNECIKEIFTNNIKIAKDDRVNIFTGTLEDCRASYKHAKKQIVLLIEGGGKRRLKGSQLHLPTIKPTVYEYDDLRAEFEALVAMAYDNDELDMLKDVCWKVCSKMIFHSSRWWMAYGDHDGWRIIKDDPTIHFKEMCDGFVGKVRRDNVEAEQLGGQYDDPKKVPGNIIFAIDGIVKSYNYRLPKYVTDTHQQNHPNMFHLYSLRPKALKTT
jgi:hypothetical protein